MSNPATLSWFAAHEIRLSWRDFMGMMTGGRPGRERRVLIFVLIAAAALHLVAWGIIAPALRDGDASMADRLLMTAAMMILPSSLMVSQAMESVTRVFYARSDLDLIFSAPVNTPHVFAVRIGGVALSTTMLSLLLAAPAVNILALLDSPGWLAAYPVALALGVIATCIALALTMTLFATLGAKRTRLIAQIVAALVGAVFIIGIQLVAIASMGTISRLALFQSDGLRQSLPDEASWVWTAPKAAMGDPASFVVLMTATALLAIACVTFFSGRFAATIINAAGVSEAREGGRRRERNFRQYSIASALRAKEWRLLARDQWLISQTLMQVFYLVPPAFMLWQGFGNGGVVPTVVIPVLVMACGQLAGGLAWLAISGEDAPQLVATAPVHPASVIRAKIEAVLSVIACLAAPILLALAWMNWWLALAAAAGIVLAACSATAIQLWFRSQAKRSNFRRRQTSSRVATFAEAFSSILWAGFAGLLAHQSGHIVTVGALALAVLLLSRVLRPPNEAAFA